MTSIVLSIFVLIIVAQEEETRWVGNFLDVSSFSSAGQNVAHDVSIDKENNTIVVGIFDSTIKIGKFKLTTDYPAVFVSKTSPTGQVLWAIQSTFNVHKNVPFLACAYSVVTSRVDSSIVVGGAYSSVDLSFAGPDGKRQSLRSYASDTSAFILKLTAEGNVQYLRGPLALQLQYVTAVEIDDNDNVYAGGFYLGAVYFDSSAATLSASPFVQGWLAQFTSKGGLNWLTSIVGSARNVINDLSFVSSQSAIALTSTYQTDCVVTTVDNGNTTTFSLQLNGTASRTLLVGSLEADSGDWIWFQTVGDNSDAITCDSYHYIDRAPLGDDLYIGGCFAGSLAFEIEPNNVSDVALTLTARSAFNSIYVARLTSNGTVLWARAVLGANIRDYSFAFRAVAQAQIDGGDDELTTTTTETVAAAGNSSTSLTAGVVVLAFVQGDCASTGLRYRPNVSESHCEGPSAHSMNINATEFGFGGEYGAAQPAGVAVIAPNKFFIYGTFSGTVTFGNRSITSSLSGQSADVFSTLVQVEEEVVSGTVAIVERRWQYVALGMFATLLALATLFAACVCLRDRPAALRHVIASRRRRRRRQQPHNSPPASSTAAPSILSAVMSSSSAASVTTAPRGSLSLLSAGAVSSTRTANSAYSSGGAISNAADNNHNVNNADELLLGDIDTRADDDDNIDDDDDNNNNYYDDIENDADDVQVNSDSDDDESNNRRQ